MLRQAMVGAILMLATLIVSGVPATAHEHIKVGNDQYDLTVGWRVEPPYVGQVNGLDLRVVKLGASEGEGHDHGSHDHGAATTPVLNAHQNLTVTYEYGGKTFTPPNFRAKFGEPGWYTAEITPTRAGKYKVHIAGTIEGVPVKATAEVQEVTPVAEVAFPESDPSAEDLAAENAKLKADLKTLEAKVQALESSSTTIPGAGALGAVAAMLGAVVLLRKRK